MEDENLLVPDTTTINTTVDPGFADFEKWAAGRANYDIGIPQQQLMNKFQQ